MEGRADLLSMSRDRAQLRLSNTKRRKNDKKKSENPGETARAANLETKYSRGQINNVPNEKAESKGSARPVNLVGSKLIHQSSLR